MNACYIGVDVGLTTAKASAYDGQGVHLHTVSHSNPRTATQANHQEVDMLELWATVESALKELAAFLESSGYRPAGIGVTGAGNGVYPVDEALRPSRPGIASTDLRAERMMLEIDQAAIETLRLKTGSRPWAAQTPVVLMWMAQHDQENLKRTRWIFTCKDWITSCLTGAPSADVSDASAAGLINLYSGAYEPDVVDALGLDAATLQLFPPLARPGDVVGSVTEAAAQSTGIPAGTPVVAGSIDVVAAPIGAGAVHERDVTIIAGTWGINSVVHRLGETPPEVTLSALFTEPGLVFAQEDAPTSMANMEWFAQVLRGYGSEGVDARRLVEDISSSEPGAQGLLFVPFIYGAPQYPGASATLLGQKAHQRSADISRALVEGITHYHRVQLRTLRQQGVALSDKPWTLAGGGARNPVWAQVFANILGHPVVRQLEPELGSRGIAALACQAVGGDQAAWDRETAADALVEPDSDRAVYEEQAEVFDRALAHLAPLWRAEIAG